MELLFFTIVVAVSLGLGAGIAWLCVSTKLPQFTIRDLLLSIALIAAGVGAVSSLDRSDTLAASLVAPVLWIGGGALIGAGVFGFVRRPVLGAVIGAIGQLLVAIAVRLIR